MQFHQLKSQSVIKENEERIIGQFEHWKSIMSENLAI